MYLLLFGHNLSNTHIKKKPHFLFSVQHLQNMLVHFAHVKQMVPAQLMSVI